VAKYASSAGWFGKLPSQGDFLTRRLPSSFVEPWDAWLSAGLADWQAREPARWLEDFLQAPSQLFLLTTGVLRPDVAAPATFCGVLMPSVDRVGRYFPFTLALAVQPSPADTAALARLFEQLLALNELAIQALQQEWSTEQLDVALTAGLGAPSPDPMDADLSPSKVPAVEQALAYQLGLHAAGLRPGQAGWFKEQGPDTWSFEATDGLPVAQSFARLMGERFEAVGQHQPSSTGVQP
jgi:type VI secretion system protein ImpM